MGEDQKKDDHNFHYGDVLMEWKFPEYEEHQRGKNWFLFFGVGTGILFITAIITFNFLFALLIGLFILIIFLHHNKQPLPVYFAITEQGIILADEFIPYKDLEFFWVIYEPPQVKKLYFQRRKKILSELMIPLTDINPIKVRQHLLEYLEEDLEREESVSEALGRFLKL